MDLVSTVRKTGSRGGVNFSWDDVTTSARRENYLGHSLKAPVGRWQQGRDLNWYAKAGATAATTAETDADRERREEIRRVKEAEEEALAKALGRPLLPVPLSGKGASGAAATGANAVGVEGDGRRSRVATGQDEEGREDGEGAGRGGTPETTGDVANAGAAEVPTVRRRGDRAPPLTTA
ncbi:hypothetical protein P8C59_004012 [Phyllachora maydis]|uniref:Multiple myeloma tumor-associated protein 2-like N-terminal domain-containing protein n=1 Tax=Phyllachora maydis TaxID=1825666 RepID=A0AAD9I1D1_9PEZI|nr:hypothetical protein P8C59_004012 [Phyllachora maydis]